MTLDGDRLLLEAPDLPDDVVAQLQANKPHLLRILMGREAALAAFSAKPPPGCTEDRWAEARRGLQHFVEKGWADQATLLGWTLDELYRMPPVWSRVDLTGAALMIDERKVVAVTGGAIVIESLGGAGLKFRRIGKEHLA